MAGRATTSPVARPRRACTGVLLAAVLGLAACGEQTARSTAADAGGAGPVAAPTTDPVPQVVRLGRGDDKPRLRCPTGARSLMIADFAVGPRGAATPQDAVGLDSLRTDEHLVVSGTGQWVWLVGPDGSVRQQVHLTHLQGWFLHTRESCA